MMLIQQHDRKKHPNFKLRRCPTTSWPLFPSSLPQFNQEIKADLLVPLACTENNNNHRGEVVVSSEEGFPSSGKLIFRVVLYVCVLCACLKEVECAVESLMSCSFIPPVLHSGSSSPSSSALMCPVASHLDSDTASHCSVAPSEALQD